MRNSLFSLVPLALTAASALAQNPVGGSDNPPAPVKVEAPKVPANTDPTQVQPVDPKTYLIGPQDILLIDVWREPQLSGGVAVRPDGKITRPLIGDIQAEGLTPDRLAAQLRQAFTEYLTDPQVTVSVNQVNSRMYTITGQVNRTGTFPLVIPIRVGDALAAAGGFRDFANKKKIVILRGSQRIFFNWEDYLKGKNLDKNIFLEKGDVINVP